MNSSNLRWIRRRLPASSFGWLVSWTALLVACCLSSACTSKCRPGLVLRDGLCHPAQQATVDAGDDTVEPVDSGSSTGMRKQAATAAEAGVSKVNAEDAAVRESSPGMRERDAGTRVRMEPDAGTSTAMMKPSSTGPVCGNGIREGTELCDGADCPTECVSKANNKCIVEKLVGDAKTCDAMCATSEITACLKGDMCCPKGCTHSMDDDCSPSCGDGVVDTNETCDPASTDKPCPSSCDNSDPCTKTKLVGSAAQCTAECVTDSTAVTNCFAVPAGWSAGTLVSTTTCPSGFTSPVAIKSEPSLQCSADGCSCTDAAKGSCSGTYMATIRDSSDPNKILQTLTEVADQSDMCRRLTSTYGAVDTITADPLKWQNSGTATDSCKPSGRSNGTVSWASEKHFCSLGQDAVTCANGRVCPLESSKQCISTMGSRQCPAGYSERSEGYSREPSAACQCSGCGVVAPASCAAAKYTFVTGGTTGPCISVLGNSEGNLLGSLPGTGGTLKVTRPSDSTEFFGGVTGTASPAICSSPRAEPTGPLATDGLLTVCCKP